MSTPSTSKEGGVERGVCILPHLYISRKLLGIALLRRLPSMRGPAPVASLCLLWFLCFSGLNLPTVFTLWPSLLPAHVPFPPFSFLPRARKGRRELLFTVSATSPELNSNIFPSKSFRHINTKRDYTKTRKYLELLFYSFEYYSNFLI